MNRTATKSPSSPAIPSTITIVSLASNQAPKSAALTFSFVSLA